MADWQPIETAPREEFTSVVLVARDHGNRCVMPALFDGDRWQSISIAGLMPFRDPTHWQPLPEPPDQSA
jgi:hypothetical protein